MTLLLKSQRLLAEPDISRGQVLECEDYDGTRVQLSVTWPEPIRERDREQVVHGMAGLTPVTVRLLW